MHRVIAFEFHEERSRNILEAWLSVCDSQASKHIIFGVRLARFFRTVRNYEFMNDRLLWQGARKTLLTLRIQEYRIPISYILCRASRSPIST